MAVEGAGIRWFSPDPRAIIPLDTFHLSRRLARVFRRGEFQIEINRDFPAVIRGCAEAARGDEEPGTWIDDNILESFTALHEAGYAHSVEAWKDGALVGGLYGVALGGAFFGESMFHRATDASKVALVALVNRLRARGFVLLDTQWVTAHLQQFGAIEIPRPEYLRRLDESLKVEVSFV